MPSDNVTWHPHEIVREDRVELLGQANTVYWLTGLSGSGKSTLANALAERLHGKGVLTYVLDGDNVRHGLNKDLGFSAEDRAENIRRVAEVAKLLYDAGVTVIVSFISPYRADRERARALIGEDFLEVFVSAPLSVCEQRDPKKLYEKARAGEIKGFTGIDAPYEEPLEPELVVDTESRGVPECLDLLEAAFSGASGERRRL